VAGTFAAAPLGFAAENRSCDANRPHACLSYAAFAAQINTRFRVAGPLGEPVELKLKTVRLAPPIASTPGQRPSPDANNERFSLIFTGPDTAPLLAAIHFFEHNELGRFEIYFGEIGLRKNDCIRYEAVFNQLPALNSPQ
jgi:hypothetical protein